MRHHDHDHSESDNDAAAAHARAPELDPIAMKAVAQGRHDVLGPSAVLGLQRAAGNSAAAGALEEQRSPVHDVVSGGGGSPLDDGVRAQMEGRMGQDFGDVRVHTGDQADSSARSVSAHAYTVGSNIVFQRGAYDPGSTSGQTLLAHELTHVVQQRSGPVDGTPTGGGVSVSSPSDRFEVEAAANAERVMAQPDPAPVQASSTEAPAVQRHADHQHGDEESVQAAHDDSLPSVQREGEEEEEVQASHDDSLPSVQREGEEEEEVQASHDDSLPSVQREGEEEEEAQA